MTTAREVTETLPDRLRSTGGERDAAIGELHALVTRAARHQASRMPAIAARLGTKQLHDAITTAANEATLAVLRKLDTFEGRSLFSTWVFKFGILHANTELKRATWRDTEINIEALAELASADHTPEQHAVADSLAQAVRAALATALTAHQRTVTTALLVAEIPIDVLAERMGTSRNALYKTLHDARKRLRTVLGEQGFAVDSG